MIISHKYQLIFVHVQKTAGNSVLRALKAIDPEAVNCPPLKLSRRLQKQFVGFTSRFVGPQSWYGRAPLCEGKHLFASDIKESLGSHIWRDYFKFAFVRNPFDRLVSWYHMIEQRDATDALWEYARSNSSDFETFVKQCTGVIYLSPYYRKSFAFNQIDYLTDENGNLLVDFVGRFESLEQDFHRVCTMRNLPVQKLENANTSKHAHYSKYYTPEAREIATQRFKRDLNAFGYTFEQPVSNLVAEKSL